MALVHSKKSKLYIRDASGGTWYDISKYVSNVTFNRTKTGDDITAIGDAASKFFPDGLKGATFEVTGFIYDDTDAGAAPNQTAVAVEALLNKVYVDSVALPYQYHPFGKANDPSGDHTNAGSATQPYYHPNTSPTSLDGFIVTALNMTSAAGAVIGFTATLQVSGAVNRKVT